MHLRHNRCGVGVQRNITIGLVELVATAKGGERARPPVQAQFLYPGDEEVMKEFVAKGGMLGTAVGPKGFLENDKDAYNYQKELQDEKLEHEAQRLWKKMKNEVIEELREKGFDV